MPSGGHNRLPKEVKVLRGTYQSCRDKNMMPEPEPGLIDVSPPSWCDEMHAPIWRELAEGINALGVYSRADMTQFRQLVETVAMARFHPQYGSSNHLNAIRLAAALLSKFGMDPSSRGNVTSLRKEAQKDAGKGDAVPLFAPPIVSRETGEEIIVPEPTEPQEH